MRCVILMLLAFVALSATARQRVLSVCVAEYPAASGWRPLSADNDRDIVSRLFPDAGTLDNDRATHTAIRQALETLVVETAAGDTVIIHFSGHGQQILTENASAEPDKVDEAFVPYDAEVEKSGRYGGEAHFTDNELGGFVNRLRSKVGEHGMVIVVIDACHSGSMDRAADSSGDIYRGTDEIFGAEGLPADSVEALRASYDTRDDSTLETRIGWGNAVFISACAPHKRNYEIKAGGKHYGSLTYYFCKAYREKGLRDIPGFLSALYSEMTADAVMRFHEQTPVIKNTIGWVAPAPARKPPELSKQPKPTDEKPDNHPPYAVIAIIPVLSALIFLMIWRKRRK